MAEKAQFTFIDLFAGIGGFRMALGNLGGQCLGFSEVDKDAVATYCANFKESPECNFGDIRKIETLPPHDILTAGVPCQSWSIAGKNLGFDDDRGDLWNDTLYLLQQAKPKAFIFENVKGLVDPRNEKALAYIHERIRSAGYYARHYLINSYDYGVPQNRVRVYIIGFRDQAQFNRFQLPEPYSERRKLGETLGIEIQEHPHPATEPQQDLFGESLFARSMSLSSKNGFNDYFLFNDLRNGDTTIHSWDIIKTSDRQKDICYLLLKNRRKRTYGKLDGNPLGLEHFKRLDPSVTQSELDALVDLEIFKPEKYRFGRTDSEPTDLTEAEQAIMDETDESEFVIDALKASRALKLKKVNVTKTVESLEQKGILQCLEIRYDFKNTKISTGLFGVNRIFLPSSNIFPTLVASDTNDYVALKDIAPACARSYRAEFLKEIYQAGRYRKITKEEACTIQGFPRDFSLPDSRARWMKLIGNSVSVPVVEMIGKAIILKMS